MKRRIAFLSILLLSIFLLGGAFVSLNSEKGQICQTKHPDNLLGCLLAGPVSIKVQAPGTIDQVIFYRVEDDQNPVAIVSTNGQATVKTVQLPTFSQYYFVMTRGAETYASREVGFDSNQREASLVIRDFGQYEGW